MAVGAAASAASGNADQVSKLSKRYLDFSERYKKIDFLLCGSDEFFVGRTGYLFGSLWLNRKLGKTIVSPEIMRELCCLIVQSGKSYAQKHSSPCPLMYSYYDTEYLGAAHGLSAILQVLIQVRKINIKKFIAFVRRYDDFKTKITFHVNYYSFRYQDFWIVILNLRSWSKNLWITF